MQEQQQKKLMMWKVLELSTNEWHKTSSDIVRKVTPALKTNKGQKPFVVEDGTLLEMVEQQPNTSTYTLLAEFGPLKSPID